MLTIYYYYLPDVVCIDCTKTIENAIKSYREGAKPSISIQQYHANFLSKKLKVTIASNHSRIEVLEVLQKVLDEVGQSVTENLPIDENVQQNKLNEELPPAPPLSFLAWLKRKLRSHWFLGIVGVASGFTLLLASLVFPILPMMAMITIAALSVTLTLILGAEFYNKARIQVVHEREPAMDTLFAISTITALVVSIAAFFVPGLPMMFEAGLLIFGFRHMGLAIRESLSRRMGLKKNFQDQAPNVVKKLDQDSHEYILTPIEAINSGDIILIEPDGNLIPIDGWSDESDERAVLVSKIYGETLPRQFKLGDRIFAGMALAKGEPPMRMRVGVPGYQLKLIYAHSEIRDLQENEVGLYLYNQTLNFAIKEQGGIKQFAIANEWLIDKQNVDHALGIRETLQDGSRKKQLQREEIDQIFSATSRYGYLGAPAIKSYLARLDKAIEFAEGNKAPIEKKTEAFMKYLTPTIILLALISGVTIGVFFPVALAIQCAVAVMVSVCPCTLGVITPLGVQTGMQKAAENNVVFSQAKTMEDADDIDCVVFDLHGTLTKGEPSVDWEKSAIMAESELNDKETLLAYFAALEEHAQHPIAKAVCDFAKKKNIKKQDHLLVQNLDQKTHHSGLTGEINGRSYIVGNQAMMQANGVRLTKALPDEILKAGNSIIYLAREKSPGHNVLLGYLIIKDDLRKDARRVVQLLKASGKEVHICTGSDRKTAERYGKKLKIDPKNICADRLGVADGAMALDKKSYIDALKRQGRKVAVIGDGVNDLLAMESGKFSIAIKHLGGDEITQQRAGAVIENGSLLPILAAFEVSKRTMNNIKQNLLFSLSYNIAIVLIAGGVLLTLGVVLNPGIGVALMILQTCLIFCNVYRFRHQKLPFMQKQVGLDKEVHAIDHSYKHILEKTVKNDPRKQSELPKQDKATYSTHLATDRLIKKSKRRALPHNSDIGAINHAL
jgi:Cu2+-exporting ATPase